MTCQLSSKILLLDLYADNAELHCSHPSLSVVERLLQSNLSAVGVFFISLNASDQTM